MAFSHILFEASRELVHHALRTPLQTGVLDSIGGFVDEVQNRFNSALGKARCDSQPAFQSASMWAAICGCAIGQQDLDELSMATVCGK